MQRLLPGPFRHRVDDGGTATDSSSDSSLSLPTEFDIEPQQEAITVRSNTRPPTRISIRLLLRNKRVIGRHSLQFASLLPEGRAWLH
jgi:hypothetical protein